ELLGAITLSQYIGKFGVETINRRPGRSREPRLIGDQDFSLTSGWGGRDLTSARLGPNLLKRPSHAITGDVIHARATPRNPTLPTALVPTSPSAPPNDGLCCGQDLTASNCCSAKPTHEESVPLRRSVRTDGP